MRVEHGSDRGVGSAPSSVCPFAKHLRFCFLALIFNLASCNSGEEYVDIEGVQKPYYAVAPQLPHNRIVHPNVRNVATYGCLGDSAAIVVAFCDSREHGSGVLFGRVGGEGRDSAIDGNGVAYPGYFIPHGGLVTTGDWAELGRNGKPTDWGVLCVLWELDDQTMSPQSIWRMGEKGPPREVDASDMVWPDGFNGGILSGWLDSSTGLTHLAMVASVRDADGADSVGFYDWPGSGSWRQRRDFQMNVSLAGPDVDLRLGWAGSSFQYAVLLAAIDPEPGHLSVFHADGQAAMDLKIGGPGWNSSLAPRTLIPFADNRFDSRDSRFVVFGGARSGDPSTSTGRPRGDAEPISFGMLTLGKDPELVHRTIELPEHDLSEIAADGLLMWAEGEGAGGLRGTLLSRGVFGPQWSSLELSTAEGEGCVFGEQTAGPQFFSGLNTRVRSQEGEFAIIAPNQVAWSVYTKPSNDPISLFWPSRVGQERRGETIPLNRLIAPRALLIR